jgi:hypothetical protein
MLIGEGLVFILRKQDYELFNNCDLKSSWNLLKLLIIKTLFFLLLYKTVYERIHKRFLKYHSFS